MAAEIKITISSVGQGSGFSDAKRDIKDLGDTAQRSGSGFSSLREMATGALREVGRLAVDALGMAARAVGDFLKGSITAAADFQSGMTEFQAVAGRSIDTAGLQEFQKLFIDLGKKLPVSTADVQRAATELVKGGIDPLTIRMGGLEQTVKFAAAAMGGDLAAAAETSAKIVGGWADVTATAEDKANLLTQATDLLTKAANASTVDVQDLALGLYNVQGTAKTAGLSLDETTTALAELAPRFSNANTAGTAFRNFLIRIQPTTDNAKDTMAALGLYAEETGSAFFDAKGEFVGVAKASQLLQEATSGLTDAEKTMALQTIFGNDAMNAAAAFADMGADGYNNMTTALENANGVSENAALKQQGLNTAMDNFKGSVEALQITIGTMLLPVLTDLFNNVFAPAVNTITTLADAIFGSDDAFNQLSPDLQMLVTIVDSLVAAFGEGGLVGLLRELSVVILGDGAAFDQFMVGLNALAPIIQPVIDLIGNNLKPILIAIGAVLTGVVLVALGSVIASLLAVAAPVIAIVAILAALYAAWETNFLGIQTIVNTVMAAIWSVIQVVLEQIKLFWQANGEEIMLWLQTTWDMIYQIIGAALQLISAVVSLIFNGIRDFITAHGTEIQAVLRNAWTIISNVINAALALIKGIITAALQLIKGDFSGAWETIKQMSATFVQSLLNAIRAGVDNIRILWYGFWAKLYSDFQLTLNGIVGWVVQTFQAVANAIRSWAGAAASAAGSVGSGIVSGIVNGIKDGAGAILSAAKNAAMAALQAAKDALGIGSPSKVFAQSVGLPMAQGMAVGLSSGAPLVARASERVAENAVQGGRQATYNRTINYSPIYNNTASADPSMDAAFSRSLAGAF